MKSEKNFAAVKMMREIRDRLSKEFMHMTYEEQKRYINEKVKIESKTKKSKSLSVNKLLFFPLLLTPYDWFY